MENVVERLIIVLLMSIAFTANATTKVAVIDTGFDLDNPRHVKLCKDGHKDFTNTNIKDSHGHGTHIAGLIANNADNSDYCLVILKYYPAKNQLLSSLNSLKYAIFMKVDIINYSGGGTDKSELECKLIKQALDQGIKVVAAAGNERSDLALKGYYPALCDERVVVVGTDHKRLPAANYGAPIKYLEDGLNVVSILPNNRTGTMSGTSQATAIRTGKIVKQIDTSKQIMRCDNANSAISRYPELASMLHCF